MNYFENIQKLMSDGKFRSSQEIADAIGLEDKNGKYRVNVRMQNYEKYGFCRLVGCITEKQTNRKTMVWVWLS